MDVPSNMGEIEFLDSVVRCCKEHVGSTQSLIGNLSWVGRWLGAR